MGGAWRWAPSSVAPLDRTHSTRIALAHQCFGFYLAGTEAEFVSGQQVVYLFDEAGRLLQHGHDQRGPRIASTACTSGGA